jgi:hypothetical protein
VLLGAVLEPDPDQAPTLLTDDVVESGPPARGCAFQRRCPHLKADLSRFGVVEGTTLTCNLHGWEWDLRTGKCLTTKGHPLRCSKL